ncbi:amidohydrolase family protein [Methylobacterium sp. NEAU 140]|uniref:amidohydrolase family protein n=1 Tax=Methylobacterium sp. NEAU 140 TaxID=3064945 RepID=UPI002735B2CB|nr:amidohydrolase family protein [Methylobacterium sp. NEAU 140]MDP4026859.1 amidohydrolase family protein [Methylobacterium sp. NEAU 140]
MEIPAEIVDAHHHLWDLSAVRYPWLTDRVDPHFMYGDYAGLRRDYGVADYRADADGLPVVATIHCEAEADRADPVAETRWLAARAAADGLPGALVAWVDLAAADREAVLDAHLAASDRVRGVRCKPVLPDEPGAPDPPRGGFSDPAWLAGLDTLQRRGLSWDLRVPFWYLSRAAEIVARQPDLPVILNHCGLPWRRDAEGLAVWRAGMAALAARPNVHVKLSELGLRDRPWRRVDNVPILRAVLDLFGPGRCLFASNVPVSGLRVGYRDWVGAVAEAVAGCSAGERAAVFAGNARRVYRLPER